MPFAQATGVDFSEPMGYRVLFEFLVPAGRRVLGTQQKRWHQVEHIHQGKLSALDGGPHAACDYDSPPDCQGREAVL